LCVPVFVGSDARAGFLGQGILQKRINLVIKLPLALRHTDSTTNSTAEMISIDRGKFLGIAAERMQ